MKVQIRTSASDGSGARRRYLGSLGPVSGVKYSFTIPGGCEQLSAVIGCDTRFRTEALDPGRYVEAMLGGDCVWDGILDEPVQGDNGWQVTAHGSGTFGSQWNADYSTWASDAPDTIISNAVGRGMNWLTSSMGHPTGVFLGQAPDSGAVKIDAMLNQLCSLGGLTWWVKRTPRGNLPQMFSLPTTPTRLLVATAPAARTLGGDINAVEVRYQASPDLGGDHPATYATVYATDASSIAKHGRNEDFLDLSNNGTMLSTDAQAQGALVLKRYQRASFAGPYVATQGQLMTLGGQATHLGVFFQATDGPMVCKVMQTDQGYGGEVLPGPVVFLVGRYEYDEEAQTADITPFQTMREDFQALLAARAARAHGRRVTISRGRGRVLWWFGKYAESWQDIHVVKTPHHKNHRPHGPFYGGSNGPGPHRKRH